MSRRANHIAYLLRVTTFRGNFYVEKAFREEDYAEALESFHFQSDQWRTTYCGLTLTREVRGPNGYEVDSIQLLKWEPEE